MLTQYYTKQNCALSLDVSQCCEFHSFSPVIFLPCVGYRKERKSIFDGSLHFSIHEQEAIRYCRALFKKQRVWIIYEDSLYIAVWKITFLLFTVYSTCVTTLLHIIIQTKLVSFDIKSHTSQVIQGTMHPHIRKYRRNRT